MTTPVNPAPTISTFFIVPIKHERGAKAFYFFIAIGEDDPYTRQYESV